MEVFPNLATEHVCSLSKEERQKLKYISCDEPYLTLFKIVLDSIDWNFVENFKGKPGLIK